jgi:hypothetical protein
MRHICVSVCVCACVRACVCECVCVCVSGAVPTPPRRTVPASLRLDATCPSRIAFSCFASCTRKSAASNGGQSKNNIDVN